MADAARPHRRDALREPHQARRELRRRATARRSASSAGRSSAATRPRRSPPRSPGCSPPPTSPTSTTTPARRASGAASADDFQRSIKGWTVTTNGPLAASRYFIRLSKTGDPNAAITYNVGNGGPTLDQRAVIDAGLPRADPARRASGERPRRPRSRCPSSTRRSGRTPPSGPGLAPLQRRRLRRPRRPTAARGRRPGQGTGHLWPVLSGERGEQRCRPATRPTPRRLLDGMARFAGGVGLIPEQDWESPDLAASPFGTDPTTASIGFVNGQPAGSASPLTGRPRRSCGSFADLGAGPARSISRGARSQRYVAHTQGRRRRSPSTAPADQSAVTGSPVTVSGTTAPGNAVDVLGHQHRRELRDDQRHDDRRLPTARSASTSPVTGGTTVLNVVAVSASGATAHVTAHGRLRLRARHACSST